MSSNQETNHSTECYSNLNDISENDSETTLESYTDEPQTPISESSSLEKQSDTISNQPFDFSNQPIRCFPSISLRKTCTIVTCSLLAGLVAGGLVYSYYYVRKHF